MNYPCDMIQDLLPLYVDGVATEASRQAVEEHLPTCGACQEYYEALLSREPFAEKTHNDQEDKKMADSLKKVKDKLDKKMKLTILCAVAAVVVLLGGYYLLFQAPIKNIDLEDITIAVETYTTKEIATMGSVDAGDTQVTISADEVDLSSTYTLTIPTMPEADISITENTMEKNEYVSVLTVTCPYFIREMLYADKEAEGVLYIDAFRTTVLNNKALEQFRTRQMLEFRDIQQVIFLKNGQETVLWSK